MTVSLTIEQVATPFTFTVEAGAPVAQAREFLRRKGIHHLPVVENGTVVGAITDRDINLMLGPDFAYPSAETLTVREAMKKNAYTVPPGTPLDTVLDHMAENRLGSAFVIDDGNLVGVFTALDAYRAFARHLRATEAG